MKKRAERVESGLLAFYTAMLPVHSSTSQAKGYIQHKDRMRSERELDLNLDPLGLRLSLSLVFRVDRRQAMQMFSLKE